MITCRVCGHLNGSSNVTWDKCGLNYLILKMGE